MRYKKTTVATGIVAILVALVSFNFPFTEKTYYVTRVIDGDTFVLENGERVRLLGIDAPEKGQFLWKEAKDYLSNKLEEKYVILESDLSDRDKYNRLLRYVFVGDDFINLEMIQKGYARALIIEPDTKYSNVFLEAEAKAKESRLGVWNFMNIKDAFCIGIYYFHYNAKGNDNENLNDEFVEFRNSCNYSVNLSGWKIADDSKRTYIFPNFVVENKTTFILHTGSGKDNATDLYWSQKIAVWNNNGDTLKMWNSNGDLVLEYSY
jgi:micrococcal nuclease